MSMSTSAYGIRKPDEQWKKMVKAWKACKEAGVEPPDNLHDYFSEMDCLPPDEEKGPKIYLSDHDCCSEYNAEMQSGIEVDLSKLGKLGFTHLLFVNSW